MSINKIICYLIIVLLELFPLMLTYLFILLHATFVSTLYGVFVLISAVPSGPPQNVTLEVVLSRVSLHSYSCSTGTAQMDVVFGAPWGANSDIGDM